MKTPDFKSLIIFESDDYMIVNKPYGFSTLDERQGIATSLLQMAREYTPDPQACHRLDKETSGCLVFAKNPDAYRHLSLQFQNREVRKLYHAVCDGLHSFEDLAVEAAIFPLKTGAVKISNQGKPALTVFNTIKTFRRHTLMQCEPLTGRMHQIRVHLSHVKAPIVADTQYGGSQLYLSSIKRKFNLKEGTEERPLISRVALHAVAIGFKDLQDEPVMVEAEHPKDMQALLRQLVKNT